jgi:hypothetical protein
MISLPQWLTDEVGYVNQSPSLLRHDRKSRQVVFVYAVKPDAPIINSLNGDRAGNEHQPDDRCEGSEQSD